MENQNKDDNKPQEQNRPQDNQNKEVQNRPQNPNQRQGHKPNQPRPGGQGNKPNPNQNRGGNKPKRKGPSPVERKKTKETAYKLARQAYAILKSPKLMQDSHYASYRREIGQFIGQCKKNKATFNQAQAKIGMVTGLFYRLDVKYRL